MIFTLFLVGLSNQALLGHDFYADELTAESFPPRIGVVDVRPLTNSILVIHYRDGYVLHHKAGQKRGEETVVLRNPLNVKSASLASSFLVSSTGDAHYMSPVSPQKIDRKTKSFDFAWFTDKWVGNRFVNDRPDSADEHWLYLSLPYSLVSGKSYRVSAPSLGISQEITLDEKGSLSDAVHVNLIGYRPDAPAKYGYVYAWRGDGASLDVQDLVGKRFDLVNTKTGASVFTGKVAFRKDKTNAETQQMGETPSGNFLGADVAECDFSAFSVSGSYVLKVEGVGRSRAFPISNSAYDLAFRTAMMGILGNRSGIALAPPFVPYTRPAPHNPKLTPGFAGKLKYTSSRYLDWKNSDNDPADKPRIEAGIMGSIDVAGWYQDAGDWDSYSTHLQVPQQLMLAYQLAPSSFSKGELNLPEKANGLPDILTEASWLPRFCYRLRNELMMKRYGTGGIGLRICGDHFGQDTGTKDVGTPSWLDTERTWIASGEDPVSTFGYAGVAAHLAICLKQAKATDPDGIDWMKEAKESYAWAVKNTRPGDEAKPDFLEYRVYALSALTTLTGSSEYESALLDATKNYSDGTILWWSNLLGASVYNLNPQIKKSAILSERFKRAIYATANAELDSANKRALRWGGDWGMPMLIGQQTTPWVQALAVASVLSKSENLELSKKYFGAVCTTADYFMGTNALNMTWMTGLTGQSPRNVFHMDGWYETGTYPRPGIIPYGQWRKEKNEGMGPWDHDWANKILYPPIDQWPGGERWFENRCCPLSGEFTIWQNMAPAALTYAFLRGGYRN
jgi:hypothetical protein